MGCVGHLFSIICWFGYCLLLLAVCYIIFCLCVCLFVLLLVLLVTCCLWVDRVIVRVCVRSKLGVYRLKEMDGYMDEWMNE